VTGYDEREPQKHREYRQIFQHDAGNVPEGIGLRECPAGAPLFWNVIFCTDSVSERFQVWRHATYRGGDLDRWNIQKIR